MFSDSNRHDGPLPRPLPCSCLPTELPQLRLHAQQAVNHLDRQLTCSREEMETDLSRVSWKKVGSKKEGMSYNKLI